MKKIGIITLNGYFNYGNRLQNYALQEVIKKQGFDVETVILENFNAAHNLTIIEKIKGRSIKNLYDILASKVINKLNREIELERKNVFVDFTKEFIAETNFKISERSIPLNFLEDYSYFVTGSDQVWNPSSRANPSIYFLDFAKKEQRIAYAPSFGVSKLDSNDEELYKNLINGMERLSVRENEGAEIINKLTGLDAPVHVDPTFLLTKEEWENVARPAKKKPNKEFILTYFLGGIPKEHKSQIYKIAEEYDLEIVNLSDLSDKKAYTAGPSEFLDYVKSAKLFCTDSFHAVVFSLIFKTPFIVYKREGKIEMYSRINTLVEKFKLEDRQISRINENELFNINFEHVDQIIEKEQEISFNYLKESFENTGRVKK